MASPEKGIDWKEKCVALEMSLVNFKTQATQIRKALAEKMKDLEHRAEEAELRAEQAELKVKQFEQQISFKKDHPEENLKRIRELEMTVEEKDKIVQSLQENLNELKRQRLADAKSIEEKSSKIKEWVSKKLQEVETENTEMKCENETLTEQLKLLRSRLQALPTGIARHIYRTSIQKEDSSGQTPESPGPPKIPKRPSSTVMQSLQKELGDLHHQPEEAADLTSDPTTDESPPTDDVMDDSDFDPMYQEVDDNHESKYEPKRVAPPQIRIERKVFQASSQLQSSVVSSSTGSEECLGSRMRLSAADQMQNLPDLAASGPAQYAAGDAAFPYSCGNGFSSHTVNALTTLPRRKKEHNTKYFPFRDDKMALKEKHSEGKAVYRMSMDANHSRPMQPPTPPMRRLPSWESRIYAVASSGMWLPDLGPVTQKRISHEQMTEKLHGQQMFNDITAPVFTTLKGKATQIRNTPFSGDSSSDSSDNEDSHVVIAASSETACVSTAPGPHGLKTSVTAAVNQSSSGATKRVSSHSLGSETSSDYAVPPDDVSIVSDTSDNSEPEHKLIKCTVSQNMKKNCLENSSYLTKLGGKVKSWKRRWFILKNGELLYYKSATDVSRHPRGHIVLDGQTRVVKSNASCTFEIITAKRTYYLTADSTTEMEHWIRVLRNVTRKKVADTVLQHVDAKEVMKGFVIKAQRGKVKRCWCVLIGKHLMFYKSKQDKVPFGQIKLIEARVEDVDTDMDTDEEDSDDSSQSDYTIAVWPYKQGPTYLMVPTKHIKDCWLYHLTVACGGGMKNVGTEYEQLISKLIEDDGDSLSIYWKHPTLLHSKECLRQPLTTLPSEQFQHKAIDISKSCHLFMNVAVDSPGIDYHVSLAQNIIHTCLRHTQLQNEVFCQLIKQTSKHPSQNKTGVPNFLLCGGQMWFVCEGSPVSPASSLHDLTDNKLNPTSVVLLQGWQLLAMCISIFLPKQSILWYLKAHLQRNADARTEVGKYAVFCQRALARTLQNGFRDARPSRMEVLSILLRNPFHHSQPISIPVHFLNSEYQVVSFDGSTTVDEFLISLNKLIGMRDTSQSGFALFTDDPTGQQIEHCLQGHLKVSDVISKWEQSYLEQAERCDHNRTVRLTYKNRLFFKTRLKGETDKERLLHCYQVNEKIVNGQFPVNKDLALVLASLMAQIEFGDFKQSDSGLNIDTCNQSSSLSHQHTLQQALLKFYPKRYHDSSQQDLRSLEDLFSDKWKAIKGRTMIECVRIYLTVVKKWPYFGAKLFSVQVKFGDPGIAWLAVQEDGISVLDYASLKMVSGFEYKDVVTFGGCRDDFMLTVTTYSDASHQQQESRTEKLLFVMSKPKVLEVTLLLAAYINAKVQKTSAIPAPNMHAPLHFPAPSGMGSLIS